MAAATERITVYGMVQGVGFRPFVARLAEEMGIGGIVRNSGGIVTAIGGYYRAGIGGGWGPG